LLYSGSTVTTLVDKSETVRITTDAARAIIDENDIPDKIPVTLSLNGRHREVQWEAGVDYYLDKDPFMEKGDSGRKMTVYFKFPRRDLNKPPIPSEVNPPLHIR